jgi:predicted RNA methylase
MAQTESTESEQLAPYFPTPLMIAERMLQMGKLQPGETMFDLGSGDGRIVIMAAREFQARAIGVEFDEDLYRQSSDRIQQLGLQETARIIHGDILEQDYSSADVLTVYLLPSSNEKVRPILEQQLEPGTRVVSHDFDIAGWTPVEQIRVNDDEGRTHILYLYVR